MRLRAVMLALILPGELLPAGEIWLDVPFVAQIRDGCGTACVSMVVKYWSGHSDRVQGRAGQEPVIRGSLPLSPGRGVTAWDMESYMRDHGFRTFSFRGEWRDLAQHLSRGRPLIVCLREGRSTLHYVVVAGIDPEENLVLVNDPARRKLVKLKRLDFENRWKGSGNWTLLALP